MHSYSKDTHLVDHPIPVTTTVSRPVNDYAEILRKLHISYTPNQYYWQVGKIERVQGWILHLSVVISQLNELLTTIIPILFAEKVPFKIIRDRLTAVAMLDGAFGYRNVGKLVSVYPESDQGAAELVAKLLTATFSFRGPAIPTDFYLGSIVYTRYGSFNAINISSSTGQSIKHIYDTKGKIIPDPYSIPFELRAGQSWPFDNIMSHQVPTRLKLLNYAYYPLSVLKNDVKGKVIKALYLQHFWRIKTCVIKEGRKNAFSDETNRDITDRLKWQYELHRNLNGIIPLPKIIDCFEECGNTYLVMEFIKGIPISRFISNGYCNRTWMDLPLALQLKLLDLLVDILNVVSQLHERGYIHRDITPENFMIDSQERIFLIDLELAWSFRSGLPTPPYRLGTPGFMSPQQYQAQTPAIPDDVYALGVLMITFFTNLLPTRLPLREPKSLYQSLLFFTDSHEMATCIEQCLHDDASERPQIENLKYHLAHFRQNIQQVHESKPVSSAERPHFRELKETIAAALSGLSNRELLSPEYEWISPMEIKETEIGNDQYEGTLLEGWYRGMSGPLWLVARAKIAGFNVQPCQRAYNCSWNRINNTYFKDSAGSNPGLFYGGAGIAMALADGLTSGLLDSNKSSLHRLETCFLASMPDITFAEGIAGQGLALIHARKWMDPEKTNQLIRSIVNSVLDDQLQDGSWKLPSDSRRNSARNLGFSNGIAGIIWFLLAYISIYPEDSRAKHSASNALKWMATTKASKPAENLKMASAKFGVILLYIKAFEIFKDPLYERIVTSNLLILPPHPVTTNFTLEKGLAALGEIYLEAFTVLKNRHWKERVDWIANLFVNCFQNWKDGEGYWITIGQTMVSANLSTGISGILHFLIRFHNPTTLTHPFWPTTYSGSKYCAQSG